MCFSRCEENEGLASPAEQKLLSRGVKRGQRVVTQGWWHCLAQGLFLEPSALFLDPSALFLEPELHKTSTEAEAKQQRWDKSVPDHGATTFPHLTPRFCLKGAQGFHSFEKLNFLYNLSSTKRQWAEPGCWRCQTARNPIKGSWKVNINNFRSSAQRLGGLQHLESSRDRKKNTWELFGVAGEQLGGNFWRVLRCPNEKCIKGGKK